MKWCNKAFETIFDLNTINISECFTSPIFAEYNNIHNRRKLSLYDMVKDFQRQSNNGVTQLQLLLEVTVGSPNNPFSSAEILHEYEIKHTSSLPEIVSFKLLMIQHEQAHHICMVVGDQSSLIAQGLTRIQESF